MQLLHLPAAATDHDLICPPDHVTTLLRQHDPTCAPAGRGCPAGIRFMPGPEVSVKLSQHQIEPGMTLGIVLALAALGYPSQVPATSATDPNLYILRYSSVEAGSLIELHHGIITRACVGMAAFPEHIYDWPGVSSA